MFLPLTNCGSRQQWQLLRAQRPDAKASRCIPQPHLSCHFSHLEGLPLHINGTSAAAQSRDAQHFVQTWSSRAASGDVNGDEVDVHGTPVATTGGTSRRLLFTLQVREAGLTARVGGLFLAKAISKAQGSSGRGREATGAAKQNKANENTGLKGIERNKRQTGEKKLVHRYGTHISVIHYHNVARKKGPTGLEMGEEGWERAKRSPMLVT